MWMMRDFVDQLRLAFRRIRREPLAWLSGVVTLGLGLGVNAALFAVVRSAWFSGLPVRAAHELALLRPRVTPLVGAPRENASWSYPMYETLRSSLGTAPGPPVEIAAFTPQARRVNFGAETADGHRARQLSVEMVSASYLRVLGVRPVIGRDFVAADDGPSGGQAVVLLSHRLWRREFAGDPAILGRSVAIERRPFPPGQHGPRNTRRKLSDYGTALAEKQKLRHIYGVLEKQFRRFFAEAQRRKGVTGENLLQMLELRLDNVVYRMGFANTRFASRQLVSHRHIKTGLLQFGGININNKRIVFG